MRTVTGYGPSTSPHPFVPTYAILSSGDVLLKTVTVDKNDSVSDIYRKDIMTLNVSFYLPDGYWFSVEIDGSTNIFPIDQEIKWRATRASQCMDKANECKGDPIQAITWMRASAGFAGLDLKSFIAELEKFKGSPDDTFMDIYLRKK